MRLTIGSVVLVVSTLLSPGILCAQDAHALIQGAVKTELQANKDDHSRWRYRDDERHKGTVSIVVETDNGAVKRLIERDGKPLSPDEARAEQTRIEATIRDSSRLARQRKDSASDDKSARELLEMLPEAFLWKLAGSTATEDTLSFEPNPSFNPPTMQAKVLGAMAGEVVIDKRQHRMKTLQGKLTQDVFLGLGLLGRMKQGGVFRVERREVGPGLWQITETHVHIDGKALFFKSIGEQQDELQTQFTPVSHGTTLEQAAEYSKTLK